MKAGLATNTRVTAVGSAGLVGPGSAGCVLPVEDSLWHVLKLSGFYDH